MNHHASRECAKFLAGIAFQESIGHLWLGIWGRDLLPLSLRWFTFTAEMNAICMVAWPTLLVASVWYAWVWHPRGSSATA